MLGNAVCSGKKLNAGLIGIVLSSYPSQTDLCHEFPKQLNLQCCDYIAAVELMMSFNLDL